MRRRKVCRYCGKLFTPDPRIKNQQIACGKASCRKARKRGAQKRWSEKNPGYFKGRYPNTKDWLRHCCGYLRWYRRAHPDYVLKNRLKQKERRQRQKAVMEGRVDIQDTIHSQPVDLLRDTSLLVGVDIQDAINPQLLVPLHVRDILPRVDIQDKMGKAGFREYTLVQMAGYYRFMRPVTWGWLRR